VHQTLRAAGPAAQRLRIQNTAMSQHWACHRMTHYALRRLVTGLLPVAKSYRCAEQPITRRGWSATVSSEWARSIKACNVAIGNSCYTRLAPNAYSLQ